MAHLDGAPPASRDPWAGLPPGAVGFSVFRSLPDGRGRQYTGVQFDRGPADADWFLRQLRACGFVRQSTDAPAYALLDAIDSAGEVVGTYDLPTRDSFDYVYRKLGLRVAYTDGDPTAGLA